MVFILVQRHNNLLVEVDGGGSSYVSPNFGNISSIITTEKNNGDGRIKITPLN